MSPVLKYFGLDNVRVMIFVDGENLSIRCGSMLKTGKFILRPGTQYRPDIYAWSSILTGNGVVEQGAIIRTYYYTAVQGDFPLVGEVLTELKQIGIGAPRVFKKAKGTRSKRVDITLATDMLLHATRKNYDIAVLVAGDEDYVPLVSAVQSEGRGVHVWSLPDGLSPALKEAADEHVDLTSLLLSPSDA